MLGIVYNPVSGMKNARQIVQEICARLEARGLTYALFPTESQGDGQRRTEQAMACGCDALVCVGGDGTLSEVVAALAGRDITLYIVPNGTGNDFARAMHLPKEPLEALEAQMDGQPVRIDCGRINGKPFLNIAGSGFDVDVLQKMEELRRIYPGPKAYRKSVLSVLSHFKAFEAELEMDGGAMERVRATIVEVANGQCIGGGMRVAPNAKADDGLFDVVVVDKVPRCLVPLLLPLFIAGWHVYLPVVRVARAKAVTLRAEGMTLNIDGRLERMDTARFEILPGALQVMKPKA